LFKVAVDLTSVDLGILYMYMTSKIRFDVMHKRRYSKGKNG